MRLLLILFLLGSYLASGQGVTRVGSTSGTTVMQGGLATQDIVMSGISSNQNNLSVPYGHRLRISSTQDINITGIDYIVDGRELIIINEGSFYITLKYEDSNSDDENRFSFTSGVDYIIGPGRSLKIYYDGIDNRNKDDGDRSLGSITLPPPIDQVGVISFSDVTSSSITITAVIGEVENIIFVMSEDPIIDFPVNNIDYTASSVFGSGGNLGGGVYVVSKGTSASVVVTGLNPATLYYAMAMSYQTSGGAISYNTTFEASVNYNSTSTLADVTTPTVQAEVTDVKEKQNELQLTVTRGNGDYIIIVANDSIPVAIDPADASDPVAAAYGNGTHLGDRNYVVYIGTSTSPSITGLARDKKCYYKVMEVEDTGNLYLTNAEVHLSFTAWFYQDVPEPGSGDPAGQTYAEGSSYIYYDFSDLTFADEGAISNGNAGLVDQGPNSNTATIVGAPVTDEITLNSALRKSVRGSTSAGLTTSNNMTTFITGNPNGFEVHFSAYIADGQTASGTTEICGLTSTTGSSSFTVRFRETGSAILRFGTATGLTTAQTAVILANGANTIIGKAKFDFLNDVFTITVNGTTYGTTVTSGPAISAQDPTTFSSNQPLYVALNNNNGAVSGNTSSTASISRFEITTITTTQQSADLADWNGFTATAGAAFLYWDVLESVGYDQEILDDSLHLDGVSAGYLDYMRLVPIIPDTLRNFRMRMTYRVSGALTTNPSGLGMGIRNGDAESNYSVFGHLNKDTNASSFGKVQIFSGNGTVDTDDVGFRSQSSGSFIPAEDSVYIADFIRDEQGNNAFHSYTVYNPADTTGLTTGWLSVNKLESQFFGTSTQAWIWFQGPDYMIGEFSIVRTREDDTEITPTPTPADVYVTLEGSDAANGTLGAPRRSLAGGVARCVELGTPCVISVGPGRFEETTRVSVPAGVSIFGQDDGVTEISGAVNLENTFSSVGTLALIQYVSSSTTSGNQYLKNLTLEGRDRLMPMGVFIDRRDDITFENVSFKDFNWTGVYYYRCDDITNTDLYWESCGGDDGSADPNYISGAVTFGLTTSDITFNNCGVNNLPFGHGYGTKAYPKSTSPSSMTNITWTGGFIRTHQQSRWLDGSGNPIPNIGIELYPGNFNEVIFQDVEVTNGYISIVNAPTQTHASTGWIRFDNINYTVNTGAFEFVAHKIEVKNSYIHGFVRRVCWQTGVTAPPDLQQWDIRNNVFELSNVTSHLNVFNKRMIDCEFTGNTFVAMPGTKPSSGPFIQQSWAGSGASSFTIENNLFQNQFSTGSQNFWNVTGTGLTSSFVRGNRSTNINIQQTITGVTGGSGNNNTITAGSNPFGLNLTGVPPWPYYDPSSSLDGAGQGGGDIGAREVDVP